MITWFSGGLIIIVEEYIKKEHRVDVTFSEEERVQYPSVTVCKRPGFDNKVALLMHRANSTVQEIEKALFNNITKKGDFFYFVSHPNMTELNHPCMTTKTSQDPGKPCCVFPFKNYEGDLHHSCQKLDFNLV